MSLDDLNREQKRQLRRMGTLDEEGKVQRVQRQAPQPKARERVTPAKYLGEVRDEMRKVSWPTNDEVVRYSLVVVATLIVVAALVGGSDFVMGLFTEWFYR